MISEFYSKVPKGRGANLRFRRFVLEKAAADPGLQEALREACKRDTLFYFNTFVWTYDPRTKAKSLPFVTYPFQDRAILEIERRIDEGGDLVIEKSRDMGASVMCCAVMEKKWHFEPGYSFLMLSRKEDLVDSKGDPDALFWKIDFIHRHLPPWLMPKGWDAGRHRLKLHFENPETGSTIDGDSSAKAASVGGRRTAVFLDEFSRMENAAEILAGSADVTQTRIFNFTPWGTANAAYKLARRDDVYKLRLHWSEHPEKARGLYQWDKKKRSPNVRNALDRFPVKIKRGVQEQVVAFPEAWEFVQDGKLRSPWYDEECRRRDNPREVAQNIDIDYQGSAYQFFDPATIAMLQEAHCCEPYWEGDVGFDVDTGRPSGLVRAAGGPLRLWLHPDANHHPPAAPYAAGADISYGTGATPSVLSIGNAITGEKVAEYASPYLRPEQFALRCVALCWLFKDATGTPTSFAWEMQGPGISFGRKVIELGYREVYYRKNEDSLSKGLTDSPGWYPSPDNQRDLLELYRTALSQLQCVNRSREALEETLAYIHTANGTIEHANHEARTSLLTDPTGAGVSHGDRVVADALMWKMVKGLGRLTGTKEAKQKAEEEPSPRSMAGRRLLVERRQKLEEAWA